MAKDANPSSHPTFKVDSIIGLDYNDLNFINKRSPRKILSEEIPSGINIPFEINLSEHICAIMLFSPSFER